MILPCMDAERLSLLVNSKLESLKAEEEGVSPVTLNQYMHLNTHSALLRPLATADRKACVHDIRQATKGTRALIKQPR